MTEEAIDNLCKFTDYYREPVEGMMFMFPGHLLHRVGSNESNEDRISISFNLGLG